MNTSPNNKLESQRDPGVLGAGGPSRPSEASVCHCWGQPSPDPTEPSPGSGRANWLEGVSAVSSPAEPPPPPAWQASLSLLWAAQAPLALGLEAAATPVWAASPAGAGGKQQGERNSAYTESRFYANVPANTERRSKNHRLFMTEAGLFGNRRFIRFP